MTAPAARPAATIFSEGRSRAYVGNADFHRSFCDLLDSAESEVVDYVIPETRPDEHDRHILAAYGNAVRRGVICRTLIAPGHLNLVQSTWDPQFNMRAFLERFTHIRLVEKVHGPFTVTDRRRVLLNLPDPWDAAEYTTSLVFEDEALARHLVSTFDHLWEDAEGRQAALLASWEATTA